MSARLSRRSFLKGRTTPKAESVPLPWASNISIVENCVRCGDCQVICPENVIVLGDGGFPSLDFTKGECSFWQKCADSCKSNVFDLSKTPVIEAIAKVTSDTCLPNQGVHCEVCRDVCDADAIVMELRIGLPPEPQILEEICNGCGACYGTCPANAIQMIHTEAQPVEGGASYA